MSRSARLLPVLLMGILAVAYVALHARIVAAVPYVTILEFPVGAAVVGVLLWAALSRRRPETAQPWRRHEQVVRPLPDPALASYEAPLARWVETGEAPERAADVLARSSTTDEREQERLRAELPGHLSTLASRRKRESYLKDRLRQGA